MTKPIPKELQRKRGPKSKGGANASGEKHETNVSIDGAEPKVEKPSNPPLKSLVERVLQERAGDPGQARDPKARTKRDDGPKKPDAGARVKKDEAPDPELVDALAGALAEGEGAIASFAVPDAQADQVQAKAAKMLKFAWKYHFIQNGITGFPSWAILLVAHLGMLALMLRPNLERIQAAWDKFAGKVKPGGKIIDVPPKAEEPKPQPAPVGPTGVELAPAATKASDLETGSV